MIITSDFVAVILSYTYDVTAVEAWRVPRKIAYKCP